MTVSRPDTPESPVEFTFPSATGTGDIYARAFLPKDPPAAVLVIHHGMAEHQERYLPFLRFLNGHGIAAYIHDMAGHGKSVHDSSSAGWFGEKDGWKALTADFHTLVLRAADDFPGVPLFVMGHSMGSFICRAFCAMYPLENVRGAIFMGTWSSEPLGDYFAGPNHILPTNGTARFSWEPEARTQRLLQERPWPPSSAA